MYRRALAIAVATTTAATTVALSGAPATAARPGADGPGPAPRSAPAGALVTDGPIHDLVRRGDTTYVRGQFHKIGSYSGPAVGLDSTTGARVPSTPVLDGQVSTAISDGAGGFYVGGEFTRAGDDRRHGVVHLRADGSVDPDFDAGLARTAFVGALSLSDDTLYVGGDLGLVAGRRNTKLMAVDAATGERTAFAVRGGPRVTELVVASEVGGGSDRLYVGTDVRLDAYDAASGAILGGFDPDWDQDVSALALDGDLLYVSGSYTNRVAALDVVSGARSTTFAAPVRGRGEDRGTVDVLRVLDGRLFVGGSFSRVSGARGPLRALDLATGAADPDFAPTIDYLRGSRYLRGVFDVALTPAGLWAAGKFAGFGRLSTPGLALLDPATGTPRPASAPRFDNSVYAVAASGARLLAGGSFYIADFTVARNLASIDPRTMQVVAGLRAPTGSGREGHQLMATDGPLFLTRTHFKGYRTSKRAATLKRFYPERTTTIRALAPTTGRAIPGRSVTAKDLAAVATTDQRLVVVRRLDSDVRFPRNKVTVYDARSGKVRTTFRVPLPGYVTEVVPTRGGYYLAGSFRRFRDDGQPAHLAIVRLTRSGQQREGFDPHLNGPVYDVGVTGLGKRVYAAGFFDRYNSSGRDLAGLAQLQSGYLEPGFRPRGVRYRYRDEVELVPFDDRVLLDAGRYRPTRLLDGVDGRALFDSLDGYSSRVSAVLPLAGTEVLFAAELRAYVGDDYSRLSFVSSAPG